MAMQHVWLQASGQAPESFEYDHIGRPGLAANRHAMQAEFQPWCDAGQCLIGSVAARQAVGDDTDVMTAFDLAVGNVHDVTENAADWCADGVQDAKRSVGSGGHRQATPTMLRVSGPAAGKPSLSAHGGTMRAERPRFIASTLVDDLIA
jgi:hypothetical protein